MRLVLVLLAAALGGCADTTPPTPSGPVFALNPGAWQPSPADLAAPTNREVQP